LGDELGDRAARIDARALRSARSPRQSDEAAPDELIQRVLRVNGREPGDRPSATRDEDLRALLDTIQILAEAVVKLTDANLVVPIM
jgi:hypothetical protein